jgi:hypothetical protein
MPLGLQIPMTQSGVIGDFRWVEIPTDRSDIPAVVQHLAEEIIGLTAVNVSWDSGRMLPDPEQEQLGWRRVGEFAISPVIDRALASQWPASSCNAGRFDEWYFFRDVREPLQLKAFCNYGGFSLADATDLGFPGGLDLQAQLEQYRPEIVVGDGKHLFVISLHPAVIELVSTLDEA